MSIADNIRTALGQISIREAMEELNIEQPNPALYAEVVALSENTDLCDSLVAASAAVEARLSSEKAIKDAKVSGNKATVEAATGVTIADLLEVIEAERSL